MKTDKDSTLTTSFFFTQLGLGRKASCGLYEKWAATVDDINVIDETKGMYILNYVKALTLEELCDAITRGADPNLATSFSQKYPPLISAAEDGDLEKVKLLLSAGADPNVHEKTFKNSPLWFVAYSEKVIEFFEVFDKHGADLNYRAAHGKSLLDLYEEESAQDYAHEISYIKNWLKRNPGTFEEGKKKRYEAGDIQKLDNKELRNYIRDTLVPVSGEADTIQGELIRCLDNVQNETWGNGNVNFGSYHRKMVDFVTSTLLASEVHTPEEKKQIQGAGKLVRRKTPMVMEEEPWEILYTAVTKWCKNHPEIVTKAQLFAEAQAQRLEDVFAGKTPSEEEVLL